MGSATCTGVNTGCTGAGCCQSDESTNGLDDNCSGSPDDDDGGCENTLTDPVHVGTGAFTVDPLVDVRFEGSDVPLEFSRRFDSMDGWNHEADTAFLGIGWTHSFAAALFTSGLVRIASSDTPPTRITAFTLVNRTPDGQGRSFSCPAWVTPGWQCTTSDGSYDVLTWESGTSRYRVDHGNGLQTFYDVNGRLVAHQNRAGAGWTVAYTGTDATDRISTVTDHLGRVLTFVYSSAAGGVNLLRLVGLTVSGSGLVTFNHDSSGLYLTTADSAAGADTYSYATVPLGAGTLTRPFITSIVRNGSTVVSVSYDNSAYGGLGAGRVSTIVADDGNYSFRWPGSSRNTCGGPDPARTTLIVDRSQSLGTSCTDDVAGDSYCSGLGLGPATCDAGTCRAYTCQQFGAGAGAGSVRFDETVNIDGNCPCGGGETFNYLDVATVPSQPRELLRVREYRTDRDGTTTSYAYEPGLGRLLAECENDTDTFVSATDPTSCPSSGRYRTLTYHATFRALVATETTRSRNSGNLITTTYTYDANALLTSVARQGYTYDSAGAWTLETQTTTYTRAAAGAGGWGRVTRVDAPGGARTDYWYWPSGSGSSTNLLRWTDTYYSATGFTYTTTASYTALGRPGSITAPNGTVRSYTYNRLGMQLATTVNAGLTTTFTYGSGSNLTCVAEPTGRTIRYVYDIRNRVSEVRLSDEPCSTASPANYDFVRYTYDDAGRRTAVLTARRVGATTTNALTWSATYEPHGLTRTTTMGPQLATTLTYDAAAMGYLTQSVAGDGDRVDHTYDALGREATATRWFVTGSSSGLHDFDYVSGATVPEVGDAVPITVTDPGSRTRNYVWDDFGQLISATSNDWEGTVRWWYQQGRMRESFEVPRAMRTVYTYDSAGRVTNIDNDADHPALVGPDYGFFYDNASGSVSCPTGSPDACAWRRGRLARVTIEAAAGTTWDMFYDYNRWGEVSYERYPDGRYSRYEYDSVGRLSRLTPAMGTLNSLRYTYDATAGNNYDQTELTSILGERWSGSAWTSYLTWAGTMGHNNGAGALTNFLTHDAYGSNPDTLAYRTDGRLSQFRFRRRSGSSSFVDVVLRNFVYASDGEYIGHDAVVSTDFDRTYFLDGANRLNCATSVTGSATCPSGSPLLESFVYDGADNRLSSLALAGATNITLIAGRNAVDAITTPPGRSIDYSYSSSGGRRAHDIETTPSYPLSRRGYIYDGMGRLSAMQLDRAGATPGTVDSVTHSIVYDHQSRPLYVSVLNSTTGVESRYWYYYDLSDRLLGMITMPAASAPTTYTVDQFAHVETSGVTGWLRTAYPAATENYYYVGSGPEGMPVAEYSFTRTGSPSTTAETWRATSISPFGTILSSTGTGPVPPWRFAGQIVLPSSDATAWIGGVNTVLRPTLSLNRWRVYDSYLGQYLQPEPLAVEGSEGMTNAFVYAQLNGWNVVDPNGRDAVPLPLPVLPAACALDPWCSAGLFMAFCYVTGLCDFSPFPDGPAPTPWDDLPPGLGPLPFSPPRPDTCEEGPPVPLVDTAPPEPPAPEDCQEHLNRCLEAVYEGSFQYGEAVCSECFWQCRASEPREWPVGYPGALGWQSCAY